MKKYSILIVIFMLSFIRSSAQQVVSGKVFNESGNTPIPFVKITQIENQKVTFSAKDGSFSLEAARFPILVIVQADSYQSVGLTIDKNQLEIKLVADPILLESVVVSDYQSSNNALNSQNAITSIQDPAAKSLSGIAGVLSSVPGVFVDGSLGEAFTRVYTRGIAASAEDDIGWYYQSLQEDGLPISAVQYNYFTPDFFQRSDLMTGKMEAIRGGKSGILFQNAPGGSFNFISKSPKFSSNEIKTTVGMLGEGNPYFRVDGFLKLPIKSESWSAALAGFYRYDAGHRNTDYAWNKGGQIRAKIQKALDKGVFTLTGKYLDDHINRHTGLAATNWNDPKAAFGQDFNYTALMLPELKTTVPGASGYDYNSADGIHETDLTIQAGLELDLGPWTLDTKGKISSKTTNWNTSFANQPLGLESFLPYFLSGGQFPFGIVTFTDVKTNQAVATVNNSGALNAFAGLPPTFEYVNGSLPNDALMGIAPWKKVDDLNEQMIQLGLAREFDRHKVYVGTFVSHSTLEYFTNASYAFATFEPEPRLLSASLTAFDGSMVALSDDQGMTNYGGLFFESGNFDVNQYAFFLNDNFKIGSSLTADLGLRYEHINHQGDLDVPAPFEQAGGLDGDPFTDYDNGQQVASGAQQSIDFTYDYLSYSAGLAFALTEKQNLFARYSSTKKAPELNYYIQNFSGLPFDAAGETQTINQLELSYKISAEQAALSITAFSSDLDNIGVSDFVFDQQTSEIYYAPVQLNRTHTNGIELEWSWALSSMVSLTGSQTFQDSEAKTYTIYNTSGSADVADDNVTDYSGNELPHTPKLMSKIALEAKAGKFMPAFNWQYMGERYGNVENSFTLPGYSTFGLNLGYQANDALTFNLRVENLFNSAGLMNFFGPNEFGSSANQATEQYIQDNPNGSFVVFPILPRAIYLSASYRW